MWLQDYLPKDLDRARILTYGYNTKLQGPNTGRSRIGEHAKDLIQHLNIARGPDHKVTRS